MSPDSSDLKRTGREVLVSFWILCAGVLIAFAIFHGSDVDADDVTTLLNISVCGDGIVSSAEVCDMGTGNNLGTYGSSTAERVCGPDCTTWGPYCGDAILQVRFTEQCDDGNNVGGDLCAPACTPLTAVPATNPGAPPKGSTPELPAPPGTIPSEIPTKVVLRGKGYPNQDVNVLLDGKIVATVRADSNADFLYTTTAVTPGTASFGFWSKDASGVDSITVSAVFEIVQSAVTTVANIFLPPTIKVSEKQIAPGEPLTLSGQTVPLADVVAGIYASAETVLKADAEGSGTWVLQVDTNSLSRGFNTAKAYFELPGSTKSGYGRSVSFFVGEGSSLEAGSADVNGDGKINLVDFSIFLLSWGTDDPRNDFNQDGTVNLADFSIMLFNWTG